MEKASPMVKLSTNTITEAYMFEFISFEEFAQYLFDRQDQAKKAAGIMQGILEARSPRLSDISQRMPGNPVASYKAIQRFMEQADPKAALHRLFQEDAPFVIGDPTEIERPQAKKTAYVGTLKDGKTRGFWLLLLATPYRGRAIPCCFVTYSSRTIADQADSRNLEHVRAFAEIKALLGERPLVLDREFSYLGLLQNLAAEEVNFVIRLNMGSKPPIFTNEEGRRIKPTMAQDGKPKVYHQLYYREQVAVNLIGVWRPGFRQPLWVMTNLKPEKGWKIYQARTKIEQSFRDLKSLLCLDKVMNKSQAKMEQMVAMMLLTYTIGLLVGESLRDHFYGGPEPQGREIKRTSKRWTLYSGLFILLKQKIQLAVATLQRLIRQVQCAFELLVHGNVRTNV
jgi:hypothetical protein